jgi:hypothetical protein
VFGHGGPHLEGFGSPKILPQSMQNFRMSLPGIQATRRWRQRHWRITFDKNNLGMTGAS